MNTRDEFTQLLNTASDGVVTPEDSQVQPNSIEALATELGRTAIAANELRTNVTGFFSDVIASPVGAIEAAAVSTAVNLTNIPLAITDKILSKTSGEFASAAVASTLGIQDVVSKDTSLLSSDKVLTALANHSLVTGSARDFYKKDPVGIELLGLFGSSFVATKAFVGGAVALRTAVSAGKLDLLAPIASFLSRASLERKATEALKNSSEISSAYRIARTKVIAGALAQSAAEGIFLETAFVAGASQSPLMQGYNLRDFAVGSTMGAGVSLLVRGLPALEGLKSADAAMLQARAELARHVYDVPSQIKDTGADAVVRADSARQMREAIKTVVDQPGAVAGFEAAANNQELDALHSLIKTFSKEMLPQNAATLDKRTLVQSTLNNPSTPLRDFQRQLLDTPIEQTKGAIAQIRKVSPAKRSDVNVGNLTHSEQVLQHLPDTMQARVVDVVRKGLAAKVDSTDDVARLLKIETKDARRIVNKVTKSETEYYFNTNTKQYLNEIEAGQLATHVDLGIAAKAGIPSKAFAELPYHEVSSLYEGNSGAVSASRAKIKPTERIAIDKVHPVQRQAEVERFINAVEGDLPKGRYTVDGKPVLPDAILPNFILATLKDIESIPYGTNLSREAIALRFNLSPKAMELLPASPKQAIALGKDFYQNTNSKEWKAFFAGKSTFKLTKDINVEDHDVQAAIAGDREVLRHLAEEQILNIAANNPSDTVSSVINSLSPDKNTIMGILHKAIENGDINPNALNTVRFGSLDFTLADIAQGDNILFIGDLVGSLRKKATDKVHELLTPAATRIASNPADLAIFGKTVNALRSYKHVGGEATGINSKGELVIRSVDNNTGQVQERILPGLEDIPIPSSVRDFWQVYGDTFAGEARNTTNFIREVNNMSPIIDRGLKIVPLQFNKKVVRYIIPKVPDGSAVQLLHANTEEGMTALLGELRIDRSKFNVINGNNANDLDTFNALNNQYTINSNQFRLRAASSELQKTGSVLSGVPLGNLQLNEFLQNVIANRVGLFDRTVDTVLDSIISKLRVLDRAARNSRAPAVDASKALTGAKGGRPSVYEVIEKTMLNRSLLTSFPAIKGINDASSLILDSLISGLNRIGSKTVGSSTAEFDYAAATKELKAQGIDVSAIWKDYNEALLQTEAYKRAPQHGAEAVQTLNSLATFFFIRFAGVKHGVLTALSLPVTTIPELSFQLKQLGISSHFAASKIFGAAIIRSMGMPGSADAAKIAELTVRWKDLGIINSITAEISKAMQTLVDNPGAVTAIKRNEFLNKFMTKPADGAELLARTISAHAAAIIADTIMGKDAWRVKPHEYDAFVNAFVKRTQGNFNTNQRAVVFQGVAGRSLSLFSTFMLTQAQNMQRYLGKKDLGTVGKFLAIQSAMFGLSSLPGWDAMNRELSSHEGNTNNDNAETSIYKLLGGIGIPSAITNAFLSLADAVIYGLPSALTGVDATTAGGLDPRLPFGSSGKGLVLNPPAIAVPVEALRTFTKIIGDSLAGTGVVPSVEMALATQNLVKPLSTMSQAIIGKTFDRQGKPLDPNYKLELTVQSILNVTGMNTLVQTIYKRNRYQNQAIKSTETDRRKRLMRMMRVVYNSPDIGDKERNNSLMGLVDRYMATGGTATGLSAAVNEIIDQSQDGQNLNTLPIGSALRFNVEGINGRSAGTTKP